MKYLFTILFLYLFFVPNIFAQENKNVQGIIVKQIEVVDSVKKYLVKIDNKEVEASITDVQNRYNLQPNDKVLIFNDNNNYYISDYYRTNYLYILFAIFAVLSILIAGFKGISSLVGLFCSFFIIFSFILPYINNGYNPILITILGSILIVAVTFYLSHGFSIKTTVAVVGTLISLIITGLLAMFFINSANLTGAASEELAFLQTIRPGEFNAQGLLLCGIIIGTLGILDDITISQASVAAELKKANKYIEPIQLFIQTMNVGKDHIASLVNTLILVYTGGFLPLLLLITNNPQPFTEVINYEMFAEEIVRTLVSSIGLVLAVPITTALATIVATKFEGFAKESVHTHHHH